MENIKLNKLCRISDRPPMVSNGRSSWKCEKRKKEKKKMIHSRPCTLWHGKNGTTHAHTLACNKLNL